MDGDWPNPHGKRLRASSVRAPVAAAAVASGVRARYGGVDGFCRVSVSGGGESRLSPCRVCLRNRTESEGTRARSRGGCHLPRPRRPEERSPDSPRPLRLPTRRPRGRGGHRDSAAPPPPLPSSPARQGPAGAPPPPACLPARSPATPPPCRRRPRCALCWTS